MDVYDLSGNLKNSGKNRKKSQKLLQKNESSEDQLNWFHDSIDTPDLKNDVIWDEHWTAEQKYEKKSKKIAKIPKKSPKKSQNSDNFFSSSNLAVNEWGDVSNVEFESSFGTDGFGDLSSNGPEPMVSFEPFDEPFYAEPIVQKAKLVEKPLKNKPPRAQPPPPPPPPPRREFVPPPPPPQAKLVKELDDASEVSEVTNPTYMEPPITTTTTTTPKRRPKKNIIDLDQYMSSDSDSDDVSTSIQKKAADFARRKAKLVKKSEIVLKNAKKSDQIDPKSPKIETTVTNPTNLAEFEDCPDDEKKFTTNYTKKMQKIREKSPKIAKKSPTTVKKSANLAWEDPSMDPIQRAGLRLLNVAAIPIQSKWRQYYATILAARRLTAIITIQAAMRMTSAMTSLWGARYAATLIQCCWRKRCALRSFRRHVTATVKIQTATRTFLATLNYGEQQWAAVTLQSFSRMVLATNLVTDRLVNVLLIQSVWRRYQVLKNLKLQAKLATKIQAAYRSYDGAMNYLHTLADVLIVQSVIRRHQACKELQRLKYLKETRAAILIQSQWRSFFHFSNFVFLIGDVLLIQRTWRAYSLRKHSTTKIQTQIRIFLANTTLKRLKKAKLAYLSQQRAAVDIQRIWRGFWCYSHYIITRYDIVCIQALIRGWLVREQFQLHKYAATLIQSQIRRHLANLALTEIRLFSLLISSAQRANLALKSCVKIQKFYKRRLKKKYFVVQRLNEVFYGGIIAEFCTKFFKLKLLKKKISSRIICDFFWNLKLEVDREVQRAMEKKQRREQKRRAKLAKKEERMLDKILVKTVAHHSSKTNLAPVNYTSFGGRYDRQQQQYGPGHGAGPGGHHGGFS